MQPFGSQTLAPNPLTNPKTVARLRTPERNVRPAPEQPAPGGEASTDGRRNTSSNSNNQGRQAIANMAAAGGDDGELHVDEAQHAPCRVVSPRKPPPPAAGVGE